MQLYYGKPLDAMTREELIDTVRNLGRLLQAQREDQRRMLDMYSEIQKARSVTG